MSFVHALLGTTDCAHGLCDQTQQIPQKRLQVKPGPFLISHLAQDKLYHCLIQPGDKPGLPCLQTQLCTQDNLSFNNFTKIWSACCSALGHCDAACFSLKSVQTIALRAQETHLWDIFFLHTGKKISIYWKIYWIFYVFQYTSLYLHCTVYFLIPAVTLCRAQIFKGLQL